MCSLRLKNLSWTVLIVSVSLCLISCSESEQSGNTTKAGVKKVSVAKKQPKPAAAKKKKEVIVPKYRYSRIGKRDPFVALVEIKKTKRKSKNGDTTGGHEELTPLQKVETGGLRLLGIIIGKGTPRAMVDAPDGKSYILKIGTKVGKNSGKVIDISSDTIFIKEIYQDFAGETHGNIIEIGLPDRDGER